MNIEKLEKILSNLKRTKTENGFPSFDEWLSQHSKELETLDINDRKILKTLYSMDYENYCWNLEH